MNRIVVRIPPEVVSAIDELRLGSLSKPSEARAPSRAAVIRALLETHVATAQARDLDPAKITTRRPRQGSSMARIVVRLPRDLILRLDQLCADLRARDPDESPSRAALVRVLLRRGLAAWSTDLAAVTVCLPPCAPRQRSTDTVNEGHAVI